ncbi:GMC oxidoreductase [Podospora fimiseda]|uniref:GMC oxidoreductase n=1 Tax=Podospora fimiseda TaxID=252190 RepID=A0AAN7BSC8_9PEZI|nr:GMC oxidoreductase [Podospora fimiseda]
MVLLRVSLVCLVATAIKAVPNANIKRQVTQLRSSYDFIIAGGGTSGLTVADRLTEAFPDKTVLVVEYGEIEYAPGVFDPPSTVWGGVGGFASFFTLPTLPNPEVNNRTGLVLAGQIVGGSSAVNGQFFDRGSRFDHDAWHELATAGDPSEEKWDWNGIFPYFKKSVTFTPPPASAVQEHGYTWDISAYGGTTPIYSSFPPFQWGDHQLLRDAWKELGVNDPVECNGGDKDGLCWIPVSSHPVTFRRSHSGLGHYAAVNTTRSNYDLVVKHQVVRVIYPNNNPKNGPPLVEVKSLIDGQLSNITSTGEVILSAGALHTPTILQRSGIGPDNFLNSADIPIIKSLPGVGSNFQDHSGPEVAWNYTTPLNVYPLPSEMSNPSFVTSATSSFNSIPATGPYTLSMSNSAIFLSLPSTTPNYHLIANKILSQLFSPETFLPSSLHSFPAIIQGYKHQLSVLASLYSNPHLPTLEVPFATGTSARAINLHPLSRGTVRLNLTNHLSLPVLDYRVGSNPVDFDVYIAHLEYVRKLINTTTLQALGAVEIAPGVERTDLKEAVKDSLIFSFMHPCCTAAMMPERFGGVVGTDLKVHGVEGVRVVDISVLPILPSSHTSATAYAIGEKAADIIIKEWRGGKGRGKGKGKGKGKSRRM